MTLSAGFIIAPFSFSSMYDDDSAGATMAWSSLVSAMRYPK